MPPFDPIQIDRDWGEWVVLQGYDTRKENDDVEKEQTRERFLYYNTCLVDLKNKSIFAEWAKTANFYGRWMPESTGSIDFYGMTIHGRTHTRLLYMRMGMLMRRYHVM